jgi:hypothetical protein
LKRIHKLAAVGISTIMVGAALTPAALASGVTRLSSGRAGSAPPFPYSTIKGKPAKFSPTTLTGKSKETTSCTESSATFGILNAESKAEKVAFSSGGKSAGSVTIPAKKGVYFCFKKGAKGTLVGKLSDGKKLTVHVT